MADVCHINRTIIEATTGRWEAPDNLLNSAPLQYALDAATASLSGEELHPGVVRKAASVGWAVATRHPFFDTNKRTAAETTFLILRLNGYDLTANSREIVEIMVSIAEHRATFEDWVAWLDDRVNVAE